MKTITKNGLWKASTSLGLLLPIALVAGCGGGGSGPSTPKATPTPTPTPVPGAAFIGTYTGTYASSSSSSVSTGGPFILRVRTNGTATGVFNQGLFDANGKSREIDATGTVNLSTGQVTLAADFDASVSGAAQPTHLALSGMANATGASGQFVTTNAQGSTNGTVTTTKTSNSAPTSLVKRAGTSGLKKGSL